MRLVCAREITSTKNVHPVREKCIADWRQTVQLAAAELKNSKRQRFVGVTRTQAETVRPGPARGG